MVKPEKAFDQAVEAGDLQATRALLDLHPGLLDGRSGLWMAAARGDRELVKFFLGRGADPDARHAQRDMGFGTPLLQAAMGGHLGVAQLLVEGGATEDILTHTAMGHLDEVRRMLQQDPSLLSAEYGTGHPTIEIHPISLAHCCGTDVMYRLLVERGAKVDAVIARSAIQADNHAAIAYLLEQIPWRDDPSAQAIFVAGAMRQDTLDLLLGLGVDLNAQRAGNGEHAGHFYVRKAIFDPFVMVLDAGIALDAQREDGGTMLHVAARMGLIDFAAELLDRGARHDIQDNAGTKRTKRSAPSTALEYASARKNPKMAEFLRERIAAVT